MTATKATRTTKSKPYGNVRCVNGTPFRTSKPRAPAKPKPLRTSGDCINLLRAYGSRYVVAYDPAYDPKGVSCADRDPWYMLIPTRYGDIGPQGETTLRIELDGRHPGIAKKLEQVGCVVERDADDGHTLTFGADAFDSVARIVHPKRW